MSNLFTYIKVMVSDEQKKWLDENPDFMLDSWFQGKLDEHIQRLEELKMIGELGRAFGLVEDDETEIKEQESDE